MSSWGSKLLEQPYSFSCVKEVGGTYSNGAIQVRKSPGHIQNIYIGVINRLDFKDIKVFLFIGLSTRVNISSLSHAYIDFSMYRQIQTDLLEIS